MSAERPFRVYIFGPIRRGRSRRYLASYSTRERADARVAELVEKGYLAEVEVR